MSERFRDLLAYARENFDIVVIDTSPAGLVVDPQIIASETDVGVYVVRYASTNQNALRTSMRQLRFSNTRLCAVLNLVAREAQLGGKYPYY
jgi:receptor protein-tyrosine kinase